jgi:hypothetical protein
MSCVDSSSSSKPLNFGVPWTPHPVFFLFFICLYPKCVYRPFICGIVPNLWFKPDHFPEHQTYILTNLHLLSVCIYSHKAPTLALNRLSSPQFCNLYCFNQWLLLPPVPQDLKWSLHSLISCIWPTRKSYLFYFKIYPESKHFSVLLP